MTKIISLAEAARILGTTRQNIRNWAATGLIKCQRTSRTIVVDADTIEAFAASFQDVAAQEARLKEYQTQLNKKEFMLRKQYVALRKDLNFAPGFTLFFRDIIETVSYVMSTSDKHSSREADIFNSVIHGVTFERLAVEYSISRERVRQILAITIRKFLLIKHYPVLVEDSKRTAERLAELTKAYTLVMEENRKLREQVVPSSVPQDIDDSTKQTMRKLLMTNIEDTTLPTRAKSTLRWGEIHTLADLVRWKEEDLIKLRQLGRKTMCQIQDFLSDLGLEFDMDIMPYLSTPPGEAV